MRSYLEASAVVSDCGTYRYQLRRRWGRLADAPYPTVVFCMLNPSTADGARDDPTIRRCVDFAVAWGRQQLVVVNLFAFRATNPKELFTADDPVGPENDDHIKAACAFGDVVCAWGSTNLGHEMGMQVRPAVVVEMIRKYGGHPKHLGLTKDGHPRHPLYTKRDTKLEDFV